MAAGAVVTRDVPPGALVMGVPAREVREVPATRTGAASGRSRRGRGDAARSARVGDAARASPRSVAMEVRPGLAPRLRAAAARDRPSCSPPRRRWPRRPRWRAPATGRLHARERDVQPAHLVRRRPSSLARSVTYALRARPTRRARSATCASAGATSTTSCPGSCSRSARARRRSSRATRTSSPSSPCRSGSGMGLTLDESALLLELDDVYWTREGLLERADHARRDRDAGRARARAALPAPGRAAGAGRPRGPRRPDAGLIAAMESPFPDQPPDPAGAAASADRRPPQRRRRPRRTAPRPCRPRRAPPGAAGAVLRRPGAARRLGAADRPAAAGLERAAARELVRRVRRPLIDGLILLVPAMLLIVIVVAHRRRQRPGAVVTGRPRLPRLTWWWLLVYAPVLMMRKGEHNGQTWGKQVLGIRVVRDNGAAVRASAAAALREIVLKSLLVGDRVFDHPAHPLPPGLPLAALGRREPRAARHGRVDARGQAWLRRRPGAARSAASVQIIWSRPGPTPTSTIGTPRKSAMKSR